jgi:hypothetical protein
MNAPELVQKLAKAWNTEDPDERLRLLEETCTADAEFTSPHGVTHGIAEYARGITIFRKSFKKARSAHGPPDVHHAFLRFAWTTSWNDGREPLVGIDFGELDRSGKIHRLVSFTGPTPEI